MTMSNITMLRMLTHENNYSSINETATVTIVKLGGDLHWMIVGILIGLVCLLSGLLIYLLYAPVRNYIRRKIPVSPEKIQRRYQTIDGWMVTKVRAVFCCAVVFTVCWDSQWLDLHHCCYYYHHHYYCCDFTHSFIFCLLRSIAKTVHPHSEDHCSACASTPHTDNSECLICMETIQVTEQVSWSANVECEHVFHHQCIREWLLKHKECPCCRRLFLSVDCEDGNLLKETLREMFRLTNQRRRETDYCVDHGRVASKRYERKRKKKLLQAAMEDGIIETNYAGIDLELAGEALENEEPLASIDLAQGSDDAMPGMVLADATVGTVVDDEEPLATVMALQGSSDDEAPSMTVDINVVSIAEDAAKHAQGSDDEVPSKIGGDIETPPGDAADANSCNDETQGPDGSVGEVAFGVLDTQSANAIDIGVAIDTACSSVVAQGSNDDETSMDIL
jgi:Ring finger domain